MTVGLRYRKNRSDSRISKYVCSGKLAPENLFFNGKGKNSLQQEEIWLKLFASNGENYDMALARYYKLSIWPLNNSRELFLKSFNRSMIFRLLMLKSFHEWFRRFQEWNKNIGTQNHISVPKKTPTTSCLHNLQLECAKISSIWNELKICCVCVCVCRN